MEEVSDPSNYDVFVIGSAVYYGSWLKEATEWVHRHQAALAERPVWLFSVGPLGTEVKDTEPQPKEMAEFQQTIHPPDQRIFFGSLDHKRLSFPERIVVKAVRVPKATSATGKSSRPGQQASPGICSESQGTCGSPPAGVLDRWMRHAHWQRCSLSVIPLVARIYCPW